MIRLRCFEKSPKNQRMRAQKLKTTPRSRAPGAPQLGSSAMGLGHGRGPLSKRSGGRLADPLQGPQSAPFDGTTRRFAMFGWPNDLGILRNEDRCVRIENSFATV